VFEPAVVEQFEFPAKPGLIADQIEAGVGRMEDLDLFPPPPCRNEILEDAVKVGLKPVAKGELEVARHFVNSWDKPDDQIVGFLNDRKINVWVTHAVIASEAKQSQLEEFASSAAPPRNPIFTTCTGQAIVNAQINKIFLDVLNPGSWKSA